MSSSTPSTSTPLPTPHHRGDQHIQQTALQPISALSPYSMLTLSMVLIILFIIKQFVFESYLISRLYASKNMTLNETERRGFINHHIAGITKALVLLVAAYPFIEVAFRTATLSTPYAPGSGVRMGDILVVCMQMLVGMYIFELIYRVRISPIGTLHHVGAVLVAQSAVAISLDLSREPDATIEFILCTVWGAFDIICELLPHISIIFYRIYPTRHRFLARLFLFACISTLVGTITETVVIFYLFGSLWYSWTLAFKIVTPLLHCAFAAAQMHGSRILFAMWKRQRRLAREEKGVEEGREVDEAMVVVEEGSVREGELEGKREREGKMRAVAVREVKLGRGL